MSAFQPTNNASALMSYRNQPLHTLARKVKIDKLLSSVEDKEEEYLNILSIVREILHDNHRWSQMTREYVKITDLLGGITNQLLLIERKDATSSLDKLVFRLFGQATVEFISRAMENIVFARLSEMEFGPIFYGVFENGRIEGFLPGTNLTPDEMTSEPHNLNIATALAQLHSFHFPAVDYLSSLPFEQLNLVNFQHLLADSASSLQSRPHQWLWNKIELFFQITKDLRFPTTEQQEKYDKLNLPAVYEEFQWYKSMTNRVHEQLLAWQGHQHEGKESKISSDRLLGRLFGLEEALCHNDLLSGNVMLVSKEVSGVVVGEEKEIKIIDYEYAAYNYRAFDLANHFYEYCGFDCDVRSKFPSKEKRLDFIRTYLRSAKPAFADNQQFIDGFDDMVVYFTLASNLSWGTWAIVQAKASTIDFDYLHYAWLRYDGYYYLKERFFDESKYLLQEI